MRQPAVLIAAAMLSACATTGDRASLDPRDPMEGFNRGVWGFNQAVDKAAIKPASTVYRAVTPVPARRGFSRVIANLLEPLNAINSLLQGKPNRAFNSLGRFLVNSTIGVGGLADHASDLGLPPTPEDFGQTLAVWGAKSSPYLVLPILGPSTVRDGVGSAVGFAADPVGLTLKEAGVSQGVRLGVTGTRVLQARSEAIDNGVDALLDTSADPYAAARDAYFQRREAEIADRVGGELNAEEEQRLLDQAIQEGQETQAPEPELDLQTPSEPEVEEPPQQSSEASVGTAAAKAPQLAMVLPADDDIAY